MTSEQMCQLALQLYTVVFECDGVPELAIWQRCLHTCRSWDLEPPTAMLISEALSPRHKILGLRHVLVKATEMSLCSRQLCGWSIFRSPLRKTFSDP